MGGSENYSRIITVIVYILTTGVCLTTRDERGKAIKGNQRQPKATRGKAIGLFYFQKSQKRKRGS